MMRWHLGERSAKVERGHGPGRGKKDSTAVQSFIATLKRLGVEHPRAVDAQRIACLLSEELFILHPRT